jgi:hypothetical protein
MFKRISLCIPAMGIFYFCLFNPFHYSHLPLYFSHSLFQQFSIHILISSTFTLSQTLCFTILLMLSHSLYLSLFPRVPNTITNMFYILVCIWSCLFLYMFIFWIYLPHMRKNMQSCVSEPGLLHLTWCPQLHPLTFKPHVIIPYGWVILHYLYIYIYIYI